MFFKLILKGQISDFWDLWDITLDKFLLPIYFEFFYDFQKLSIQFVKRCQRWGLQQFRKVLSHIFHKHFLKFYSSNAGTQNLTPLSLYFHLFWLRLEVIRLTITKLQRHFTLLSIYYFQRIIVIDRLFTNWWKSFHSFMV